MLNIVEKELIKSINYIGSYTKEVENNKLEVLIKAKDRDLVIPNTFITSSKKELQFFYINILAR